MDLGLLVPHSISKGGVLMANKKQTSPKVATVASKVLRGNYSKNAKTAAGSALAQTKSSKKSK